MYLGSERKQRALSNKLVSDNLEAELAPFSFQLSNGGEELRGAAFAYTPSLTRKVVHLLDRMKCKTYCICSCNCLRDFMCREGTLTWHGGMIPDDEIWLKLGGDKGRGYFKINFQIFNTPAPNSVHNTCVFSCFEASDTLSNLHVALDRFRGEVANISTMKWE